MNFLFGIKKNKGIDMEFVRIGLKMLINVVYFLYKFIIREYLEKKVQDWGVIFDIFGKFIFNVKNIFKCYK